MIKDEGVVLVVAVTVPRVVPRLLVDEEEEEDSIEEDGAIAIAVDASV